MACESIDVADVDVVATLDVPDGTHQLLLDGDRLLVVTQPWTGVEDTIISVFDVTDPSDPSLLRRSHLEGRVVATRAIGGVARLVLTSSLATRLPFVYPEQFGLDEERALAENRRIIQESAIDEWLPRWFDEGDDGSFGEMSASLDCSTVAAPRDFAGLGHLVDRLARSARRDRAGWRGRRGVERRDRVCVVVEHLSGDGAVGLLPTR